MKTTLIFIMAITIIFNSYADDLHFIKDRLPTENKKLKTNNKYKDDGTYIIIDENNIKNSTASITKYKSYSKVLAYNNITNTNTQIKADRITYRTGNMPFFIEYNNINDKNAHINLSYFKPWLLDGFGYSKFQIKQGS
ncbi:MAG: hypothetical protein ACL7AX_08645 [Candidatus Arsenophonus phytopathogenicus]